MSGQPARIYVAGHRGLVGSAVVRALANAGRDSPILRGREQLDLTDQRSVAEFFRTEDPDVVVLAAARVGGIHANNTRHWDFIYENLVIETNVIAAALAQGVRKLVFLGSSCIYPKHAQQPMREEYLLTGALEPTNEPYAIAKLAGVKLVEAAEAQHGRRWVSLLPTNLYGPGDNFDLESSHVLPAMLRKFHEAKSAGEDGAGRTVTLWGSGTPRREFLHVDDLGRAIVHVIDRDLSGIFNVGFGSDVAIRELADLCARVVGYQGDVHWDSGRPDGTPRKLLDSSRILETGWRPEIALEQGIASTYDWYRANVATARQGAAV